MSSIEPAPRTLKINYVVYTQVVKIEEKFTRDYVSGFGYSTEYANRSLGWFVYLKGSYEALFLGMEKPSFGHGDKIRITFEKVQNV